MQRKVLGLDPIPELRPDTSFKQGVLGAEDAEKTLRKAPALAELSALQTAIQGGEPHDLAANRQSAVTALERLAEDEGLLTLARQHQLIATVT